MNSFLFKLTASRVVWDSYWIALHHYNEQIIGSLCNNDIVLVIDVIEEKRQHNEYYKRYAYQCLTQFGVGWIYDLMGEKL